MCRSLRSPPPKSIPYRWTPQDNGVSVGAMADHEAAWAKGLAQEQAHQRELLATFRGELAAFARECAKALTALDACVGGLGEVFTALETGAKAHDHAKIVLDVTRRFRQLAPGSERPEDVELYSSFGEEGDVPGRAVGHAKRLLAEEPKRNDRELLQAVVQAAGARAQVEDLLGPAPVAALAGLAPLARWFPGLATVDEKEAAPARKKLATVLEAAEQGGGGELVELAAAASLASSVREASEHAGASARAVEEGRLRQVIAEARVQLKQDLDELRGTLDDAKDAPDEWLHDRKAEHEALTQEVEEKLERLERTAGWLNNLLPRLQLVSRGLGSAQRLQAVEGRIDPQQPVTAEAARTSLLLELSSVWGPLLPGARRAARPERRAPLVAVAIAVIVLLGAGAGLGAYFATRGGGKKAAETSTTAPTTTTAPTESGPLSMRLYPIQDFLILQWVNTGTVPIVDVTVAPQDFNVVSGTDCKLETSPTSSSTTSTSPGMELRCRENIKPGPEPSSIRIDTDPPGSTGSVLVTYKDSGGKVFGPIPVELTQEEQTTASTSTTQAFPPNAAYDGCLVIDPQGKTTGIAAAFTVSNPQTGPYQAAFAESPSGRLSGSGMATNGGNPIVVPMRATAFGTYDKLSITAPDGKPVKLGTLAGQLPLELNAATDKPNGCSPSKLNAPPTPTPPTTSTRAQAAQDYLHAVAPANAAIARFNSTARTWTDSTGGAEALAAARPLISAFNAVQPRLLEIAAAYPAAAGSLRAGVAAAQRINTDLVNLARLDTIGLSTWARGFGADIAKLVVASKRARADLGLPPISR